MEINYVVKLPITNNVELKNDYGNINLEKLEGRAIINCDYGKITTKELMADNNDISFDYTNNSYFEYIKSGKINADYSGFTVSKAKQLTIKFDLDLEYASLRDSEGFEFTKKRVESSEKYYQGYYGNSSTSNLIKINSDYGSVSFKRN